MSEKLTSQSIVSKDLSKKNLFT